ncbi:MAG: hydrogenase maturation nickel metallochaperone HypA [Polyangiaceae bacterium]|nr:hydrogenase maturation nickel metallochaperone HypA [Polyangiaceae bacterium]
MHELGLTMEIVEIAVERAQGRSVKKLRVEVGKLAAVVPDSLRFCFDLCAKGTVLEGAELVLDWVPGRARCGSCGADVFLKVPYGQCTCGHSDLTLLSGHELIVADMEVV